MTSSFIPYMNTFIHSIDNLESISAMMKEQITSLKKDIWFPENYFYLTHLVNASSAYWSKKSNVTVSSTIARKLFLGKKLEKLAALAFRNLPGFVNEGAMLDGLYVGIPGVRGEIDFKIGDSIIEFKTKDALPKNTEEIFRLFPQDVEQLIFYAAMHPSHPLINFLVFMNNVHPYKIHAYKITISKIDPIKEILKNRIQQLSEAMEKNDCNNLGRCRYFDAGCKFRESNICKCQELQPVPIKNWKQHVIIEIDENFSEKIQAELDKVINTPDTFTTKDIIAPRKYFMEKKLQVIEEWTPPAGRDGYLACMYNLIRQIKGTTPNKEQYESVRNSITEKRMHISQRWINLITSAKPEGELLPFIVKISESKETIPKRPAQYAVAELAIICASYNKTRGLVFTIYPNFEDLIQVHEVKFQRMTQLQEVLKERIDKIVATINDGTLTDLEPCPSFFNTDHKCPLDKVCHSTKGQGCLD